MAFIIFYNTQKKGATIELRKNIIVEVCNENYEATEINQF